MDGVKDTSLWKYGVAGAVVADKVCECLNLQQCQRQLVNCSSNFFLLGGDSLAATRVTRGLYAFHHGIFDSRNLGGATGTLSGPFSAKYLLQSKTLGDYVDFLDSHSVLQRDATCTSKIADQGIDAMHNLVSNDQCSNIEIDSEKPEVHSNPLYESLIEAITLGLSSVAIALLGSFVLINVLCVMWF